MSTGAGCCSLRGARGFQSAYRRSACPVRVPLLIDSVPGLSLMSKRQDEYRVRLLVVAVKCHVARIAEIDDQLSQIGFILKRPPYSRLSGQQLELAKNRLRSPTTRRRAFLRKKLAATLQPTRCTRRNDQSWQAGIAFSLSVPQLSSHCVTSCPVRCWPVS